MQANLGLSGEGEGHGPPENFEIILAFQRFDFMHFGAKRDKKELLVIVKFDVARSAVSPFKYYILHETSRFASLNLVLYECKFE